MRGQNFKSILAENLRAALPQSFENQNMSRRTRMCWAFQKDKKTHGGHIKTFTGGPMKFICKECVDAKLKEKNT